MSQLYTSSPATGGRPVGRGTWVAVWLALVTTAFLATIGSFGASFGIMTDCTNSYDCSDAGCAPCDATGAWLTAGWVLQGLLLVAAIVLLAIVTRRRSPRTSTVAAVAVCALSVGSFLLTSSAASGSYCQPGERVTLTGQQENYCRY